MIERTAPTIAFDQPSALITQDFTRPGRIVVTPGLLDLVQAEIIIIVLLALE
jgi:hypothetical protein